MKKIKKAELAASLMSSFPEIPQEIMNEIRACMGHYMLFSSGEAKCTACGYEVLGKENVTAMYLEHGVRTTCPGCMDQVTAMKSYMKYSIGIDRSCRNFVIFLARDGIAYARCLRVRCNLHRENGKTREKMIVEEHQRYAFADGHAIRYGRDYKYIETSYCHFERVYGDWKPMSKFTEPIFERSNIGYSADNSYAAINIDCLYNTCLRYSQHDAFDGACLMRYLAFYMRHPNVEYLMKAGFGRLVRKTFDRYEISPAYWIDWKQNDLRKMLGMNGHELKLIQDAGFSAERYHTMQQELPDFTPEERIRYADVIGYEFGTLEKMSKCAHTTQRKLLKYLWKQGEAAKKGGEAVRLRDYEDYYDECKILKYDLKQNIVLFPRSLPEAHRRTSGIINQLRIENEQIERMKNAEKQDVKAANEVVQESEEQHKKELERITAEREAADKRVRALEKKAQLAASSETATFKLYFEELQAGVKRILDFLQTVEDAATTDKLRSAVKTYIAMIAEDVK